MTAPTKRRVTFTKAETYVDGGVKMVFVTSQEQSGALTAELFSLKGMECDLYLVEPDQPLELSEVPPAYQKTTAARSKSPSQVLRQEMWAYFTEAKLDGSFDEYYEKSVDALVRHWHDKRVGLSA